MQNIPDKEFDQLFKDRFENAEITPSADFWAKIEPQLQAKPKRVLPVYWLSAAAVVVAMLIVYMLMPQLPGKPEIHTAKVVKQQKEVNTAPLSPSEDTLSNQESVAVAAPEIQTEKIAVGDLNGEATVRVAEKNISPRMQPLAPPAHLKDIPTLLEPVQESVIKENITPAEKVYANAEDITQVVSKQDIPVEKVRMVDKPKDDVERREQGKGIQNIGELINYVVEKVDKREDKLIRFKTDDDESSLIGLNIGMFKISQRKHK